MIKIKTNQNCVYFVLNKKNIITKIVNYKLTKLDVPEVKIINCYDGTPYRLDFGRELHHRVITADKLLTYSRLALHIHSSVSKHDE